MSRWKRMMQALGLGGHEETQLGAYTLDEKIGEGGMGVVYKASHAFLKRPAAIKLLPASRSDEQDIKRFEREVQRTSMLTHPNTIAIYDFGRTREGTFYYAMEYLDGMDLQALVDHDGPQDPARVAHILAQVAGALAEAHGLGLVHRDVKPANVMLCERGGVADAVKVLDFGLLKEVGGDVTASDATRVVGTPLYLSPEAITAPETVDGRSDLYALGALGYFLLTGEPPFMGKSFLDVCGQHLHSAPVPVSEKVTGVPAELAALIMACLAKDPAARPATAAAVRSALVGMAAAWTDGDARAWWAERALHGPGAATLAVGTTRSAARKAVAAAVRAAA